MTPEEFRREFNQVFNSPDILEDIAKILEDDIIDHINKSISIDGAPYPPLKESTLKNKKDGETRPIVGIIDSIRVESNGRGINIRVDEDYASYLQNKYNFIGISDEAVNKIDRYIQSRIDKRLGD